MNVSFDLFTELIGYRFFIQQRVLDDVAFRIGHHDVVVGNFDIFARFLPIFHTFEEDITVVFTEVQIAVLIFHNVVNCITSVLVLEVIQHVVGSPMIPRHHVIPVAILHRKFDATFTDNVFKGDAFLTWNTVHGRGQDSMLPDRGRRSILHCCRDKLRHRSDKHRPKRKM